MMLTWLSQTIGTILAAALLLCAIGAAAVQLARNKKKSKRSCTCGSCPLSGRCDKGKVQSKSTGRCLCTFEPFT